MAEIDLHDLGWDAAFAAAFTEHSAAGLVPGRVAIEDKHSYSVVTAAGERPARVTGKVLHQTRTKAGLPKVGDWVALKVPPGDGLVAIHAVLPRRTTLARKNPGRTNDEQVLAANVDTAFVVQALDASFNLRRLERFLVMVHEGGVKPVVVLNKSDLCPAAAARLEEAQGIAGNVPVVVTTAQKRQGVTPLRPFLKPGRTVVFIGSSGVGKSSLINQLYGEEIQATIEVREDDAKGRHTTSWRELILLPGGALVIDTPGMREFHMWLAGEGLEEAFPDIAELSLRCHFRDCTHSKEKRCAVQEALADGRLEASRFASHQKLRTELDFITAERLRHTYLARKRDSAMRRNERNAKW